MKKTFLLLLPVLFLSGCSLWNADHGKSAPNEPIRVEMEITERNSDSAPEAAPAPKTKTAKAKPKVKSPAPAQKRVELPKPQEERGGLAGELNSVERGYLDEIREHNKRTREENASKVFGGWGL